MISAIRIFGLTQARIIICALFAASNLLYSGIVTSQPSLIDKLESALTCVLVESLLAEMPVEPVYAQDGAVCAEVVPDESERNYFTDSSCLTPLDFEVTTLGSHCDLLLDPVDLGEGSGVNEPVWTLSPGSRLDVGARPLDGVIQPYLQRQIYTNIDTPRGVCSLEMRVYANSPVVSNELTRPSLLALHGGSWSVRGFGFFGLELTIPHYVQQGFVVYAPFYRLLDNEEGSAACNQATIMEIEEDASTALAWVADNAADYGSSTTPVVFGQSAGAHLATSLLVNEPEKVAGAVLFYPPTDFTDFTSRVQQGSYTDEQGLGILERVLGVSAEVADISVSPIPENSFPIRIVEQGIEVPPVMMVHGMQDSLVEARQSIRLCDALGGQMHRAYDDKVEGPPGLREIIPCGTDSEVQLIKEGQHALDLCIVSVFFPTDLCPSGSEDSRQEVSAAIADATLFAARVSASGGNGSGKKSSVEVGGDIAANDAAVESEAQSPFLERGGVDYWWLILLSIYYLLIRAHISRMASRR